MSSTASPISLLSGEDDNQLVLFKVACAWEPLLKEREREKRAKYGKLSENQARQRIGCKVSTIPVVVSNPGLVGGLEGHLSQSRSTEERRIPSPNLQCAMRSVVLGSKAHKETREGRKTKQEANLV